MEEKELYKIISRNLKEQRSKKKMSQEEFSSFLNVSFYNYQRIEAPNTLQTMSLALLINITNTLGITVSDLLK